jgi:hypothetical protein
MIRARIVDPIIAYLEWSDEPERPILAEKPTRVPGVGPFDSEPTAPSESPPCGVARAGRTGLDRSLPYRDG